MVLSGNGTQIFLRLTLIDFMRIVFTITHVRKLPHTFNTIKKEMAGNGQDCVRNLRIL